MVSRQRARVVALLGGGGVVAAAVMGGVWTWIRSRDEPYDDDREIARYGANLPREVIVPEDVTLPAVSKADPVNPVILDVALGKKAVRVHGRVAFEVAGDASAGFGPLHASGLFLRELAPMAAWGKKLNGAARMAIVDGAMAMDGNDDEVNLLIDEDATYQEQVELFFTLGQEELSRFNAVVRTPSGLGSVRISPPRISDARALRFGLCVEDDGVSFRSWSPMRGFGQPLGCGWKGKGFDVDAYGACYKKVEAVDLDLHPDPAVTVPLQPITLGAARTVRFGRALTIDMSLRDLGFGAEWAKPCDG